MKEELKRMKRVLRRLGFINADNVLTVKVGTSSVPQGRRMVRTCIGLTMRLMHHAGPRGMRDQHVR